MQQGKTLVGKGRVPLVLNNDGAVKKGMVDEFKLALLLASLINQFS